MSGTPKTIIRSSECGLAMLPDGSARLTLSGSVEAVIAPAAWRALGESAGWFTQLELIPAPTEPSKLVELDGRLHAAESLLVPWDTFNALETEINTLRFKIDSLTVQVANKKKIKGRK